MISANRYQEILLSVINNTELPVPTNRDETVLIAFLANFSGSGSGGGGTSTNDGIKSISVNNIKLQSDSNKNINIVADTVPKENSINLITSGAVYNHTNNSDIHITQEEKNVINNLLHNKGFFLSEEELNTTYPTGESGDYATVLVTVDSSTDLHMFIWDTTQSKWFDTSIGGMVTSINNRTGDVTLTDLPYDNTTSGLRATTLKNALDEVVVLIRTTPGISEIELDNRYLTKEKYASEYTDGNVKVADKAEKIEGIDKAQPLSVYGVDINGNQGFYILPINSGEQQEGKMEQIVLLNVTNGQVVPITSVNSLKECELYVQLFKFKEGSENVISTVKKFNNTNKDSFYYNLERLIFDNGMCIKTQYVYPTTEENDYYCTSEIDLSEFI